MEEVLQLQAEDVPAEQHRCAVYSTSSVYVGCNEG
jgi:hypothetical protein